jgi:protoporphyrinogen oxidase
MTDTIILGAGLTGLATAYYLEKAGSTDYQIFEKENEIGGLCRSIRQDGFTFDYTGHLLHINDPDFRALLKDVMPFSSLNFLHRKSRIFSHNTYTHYPFQTNLYGLPTSIIAECIEGFIKRKKIKNPKTFYSWALTHFGKGFTQHFFNPYQRKIFCHDPKKFTATWTGRFVPQTSLESIIEGALKKPDDSIGYNASFYYPKNGGIDHLVHAIAQKLKNKIKTSFEVETIDLRKKCIYFSNGYHTHYNKLITTIPLNQFLQKTTDKSTTALSAQARHLKVNSVLNINLGINRANIEDYHWCYFPEKQFPFYRAGFSHHFSEKIAPHGTSALYIEHSYMNNKKVNANRLVDHATSFFGFENSEIITRIQLHIRHAYVIYNGWRDKNLSSIFARLAENNIYTIGRYGAWKYSSMQESVIDGKRIVETVLHRWEQKKEKEVALPK